MQKEILPVAKLTYDKVNFELLSDIFDRFFTPQYVFLTNCHLKMEITVLENGDHTFTIDEIDTKEIKVPKNKLKLEAHFQKCFHTPQPEQRSADWYKYRESRITASDTATALDLNPYEPVEHFIVKKIDRDRIPFIDGIFVFHGRKYEPIATFMYEHIYNNKVTEFGCLTK